MTPFPIPNASVLLKIQNTDKNVRTYITDVRKGIIIGTDKRTDVWSRDFIIWKINFGLWAVAWAELWNKRVWADYKQLFGAVSSIFHGLNFFFFYHFFFTL